MPKDNLNPKRLQSADFRSLRVMVRGERGSLRGKEARERMIDLIVDLRCIAEEAGVQYTVAEALAYYRSASEAEVASSS